jgi:hypothetical protein
MCHKGLLVSRDNPLVPGTDPDWDLIPTGITNDTPAAYEIVIPGLVPSIRAGDGAEFLSGIAETCAAGDPRVTHEDDNVRCTRDMATCGVREMTTVGRSGRESVVMAAGMNPCRGVRRASDIARPPRFVLFTDHSPAATG